MRELHKGKEKGFTLVEILIALAIMSIITTAVYQLYISQYKTWISQDLATEMQQNARISIDQIGRDLLMTGYGVAAATAIEVDSATTASNASQIAFRFKETAGTTAGTIKRVMYWRDAATNTLYRKEDSATTPTNEATLPGRAWSSGQPLSENVTALAFTYFDQNGDVLGIPPTNAYRVKVFLTVETSKIDPITNVKKNYTLSTDVRPRNVGIEGTSADTTAPDPPATRPTVTDPHICGKLDVSWPAVVDTAGDLAGYDIWYGTATNDYSKKISVGNVTSYTLTGLDNGVQYYIAIASRDTAGNPSQRSLEATTGNGSPVNDSTPDADEPGQPVGLDATASPTDTGNPWVNLEWTSNATTYSTSVAHAPAGTGPDTDVTRYEIDRAVHGSGSWSNIGNSTTATFTDSTLDESNKCTTYDYRVRAVTVCRAVTLNSGYSSTVYGDKDLAGGITDVPNNGATNTTPRDGTPPDAPTGTGGAPNPVVSKAGYRRVFLTWDNPTNISKNKDLDYIAIRYNASTDNPASITDGTGVENDGFGGIFNKTNMGSSFGAGSTSLSYTHYGIPGCDTTPACLTVDATYYYSLFAVDKCGNASASSETAKTVIDQCGEDTTAPTYGAVPKVTNFNVSACTTPYNFTWDRTSDDYPGGIYDLVGYYMYKTSGSFTYTDADTKLNSDVFINPPSSITTVEKSDLSSIYDYTDDDPSYAGNTYMYYVMGIDCVRENNTDAAVSKKPWSSVPIQPKSVNGSPAPTYSPDVITVKPGRATFGNNTSVTTGFIHLPTFGNNSGIATNNYYHNTVDVRLKNTSAGTVMLKSMVISWGNTSAYLKKIYRVNTDGSLTELWITATPAVSGSTVAFSVAEIGGVGIASPPAPVISNPWKLRFVFTDTDGNVTDYQDMRDMTVTMNYIEYDKKFQLNGVDMATPPTCTLIDPETVNIPVGPEVSSTILSFPSGWVSSSTTPEYWTIGSATNGSVQTRVFDSAVVGISSVKLYYKVTDKTVTAVPASGYTELPPASSVGSYYNFTIPANSDNRIWYYVIAVDNKGNFDREPEIQTGAYTYDHAAADPCLVTPKNPTVLLGNATRTPDRVALSWTEPTQYTNNTNKYSTDTFKYIVYRKKGSDAFAKIASGGCYLAGGLTATSCTDDELGDAWLGGSDKYTYYVKAVNLCTNTPACQTLSPWPASPASCLSSESNTVIECAGTGGKSVNVDKTTIYGGESFVITAFLCSAKDQNGPGESGGNIRVDSVGEPDGKDDFPLTETADTGYFYYTVPTTTNVALNTSTLLVVNTPSTITVDPGASYGGPKTITVSGNPCNDTPNPVTSLALAIYPASGGGAESSRSNSYEIHVQFTAPQLNTNGSELIDLASYELTISKNGTALSPVQNIPLSRCTSSLSNPAAGTTCDYIYTADAKMKDAVWSFSVKAVDSCSTPINSTAVSKGETCTGASSCPATY